MLGPFAEGEVDLSFFHDRFQPKFVRGIGVVKGEEEQLQDVTLIPGTSLVVSGPEDGAWVGGRLLLREGTDSGSVLQEQKLGSRSVEVLHSLPEGTHTLVWENPKGRTILAIPVELLLDRPNEVDLKR